MRVQVVVRVRPMLPHESGDENAIVKHGDGLVLEHRGSENKFDFDSVYDETATNEDIYKEHVQKSVDRALDGFNNVVFAYGITSSGKTHTMQGNSNDRGLIGRVADDLFAKLRTEQNQWKVQMSYLEIYNEKVFDLLEPKEADLPIREAVDRTIFVPGLAKKAVRTADEFDSLYNTACENRRSAPTALNVNSSRSHAVLSLTVRRRDETGAVHTGLLHLVDLAGSEDNRQTANSGTGVRMTESCNINTSLFVLGQVVDALATKRTRIPYRDSKLTRLLQDSLGGSAYSLLVSNVAPGRQKAVETVRTLTFAAKSRTIVNQIVKHVERPVSPPPLAAPQPMARAPLRALGLGGASLRVDDAMMKRLNARTAGQSKQPNGAFRAAGGLQARTGIATTNSEPSLLTPLTHSRALEQIRERANQCELAGDLNKALEIYRGALALVGDDERVLRRIRMLEERIKLAKTKPSKHNNNSDDDDDDDRDEDAAWEPEVDGDENQCNGPPATVEKKKRKKAAADKKGAKKGSYNKSKKIKSALDNVEVGEDVLARLLARVNTGTLDELCGLHAVGRKRAGELMEARPFVTINDLPFGPKTLDAFVKKNSLIE